MSQPKIDFLIWTFWKKLIFNEIQFEFTVFRLDVIHNSVTIEFLKNGEERTNDPATYPLHYRKIPGLFEWWAKLHEMQNV